MKQRCLWLVLCIIAAVLRTPAIDHNNLEADRQAILVMHARERQAHLRGDAALLASGMADSVLMIQNGAVQRRTREEVQSRFEKYFKGVRYFSWDDVIPPEIHISDDRQMAWAAVQIKAKLKDNTETPAQEHEFVSSWISTYKKEGSSWRTVAMSSGCDPACGTTTPAK